MVHRWLCLVLVSTLAFLPVFASDQIGFKALVVNTSFSAFDETMRSPDGLNSLIYFFQKDLPHLEINRRMDARYIALAGIFQVEYSRMRFEYPAGEALLAKVYLLLLIYDVQTQREVLRETTVGYAAEAVEKISGEGAVPLLQRAFQQCFPSTADMIGRKFPLYGKIQGVAGPRITVNFGQYHGIRKGTMLEVLDNQRQTAGRFEVISVEPRSCMAMSLATPAVQSEFLVRPYCDERPVLSEDNFLKAIFGKNNTLVIADKIPLSSPCALQPLRVQVAFLARRQGEWQKMYDGVVLSKNSDFCLAVKLSQDACVYFLVFDAQQKVNLLFPHQKIALSHHLRGQTPYFLPPPGKTFFLDDNPGHERFFLLVQRKALPDLEERLARLNGEVNLATRAQLGEELLAELRSGLRGAGVRESQESFSLSPKLTARRPEDILFDEVSGTSEKACWLFTVEHN